MLVLATAVMTAIAAALMTSTLDDVYQATSRLIIVQPERPGDLGGIQAAQITARTYSEIMRSPNISRLVEARLSKRSAAAAGARGGVEVRPVPETQLIAIIAEGPTPEAAGQLAEAYTNVVVEYAESNLEPTTRARLSIADPATVQQDPVRPKPTLYVLLAGLIGLALGIGAAVFREQMDARLRSAQEIEDTFEIPVLGRIPRRGRSAPHLAVYQEAFRLLRVSVGQLLAGRSANSVAITSASSGEGKSTVTLGLALAASEAGQRVVVVDGDVQRGVQSRLLKAQAPPGAPGLADVLLKRVSLEDVLTPTSIKGVRLLPAGRFVGALSSAVETAHARALLSELADHADIVLIDCPPLRAGADASVLTASAGSVLLVSRIKRTSRPEMREALQQLQRVHADVIGCVVNGDPLAAEPYGYLTEPRERAFSA